MKTPSFNERAALGEALDHAESIGTAEENRAAMWDGVISLTDRQRAVGVAGLTKDRASDTLASFTPEERARVRSALAVHISRMEFIAQCMLPANTNAYGWLH